MKKIKYLIKFILLALLIFFVIFTTKGISQEVFTDSLGNHWEKYEDIDTVTVSGIEWKYFIEDNSITAYEEMNERIAILLLEIYYNIPESREYFYKYNIHQFGEYDSNKIYYYWQKFIPEPVAQIPGMIK